MENVIYRVQNDGITMMIGKGEKKRNNTNQIHLPYSTCLIKMNLPNSIQEICPHYFYEDFTSQRLSSKHYIVCASSAAIFLARLILLQLIMVGGVPFIGKYF